MYQMVIADDEATIRNGLKHLVQSYGLEIDVTALASNGVEVLEAVRHYHPELLLIDINMPQMDGLSAIEEIIKEDDKMKIIISGYGDFTYAQRAVQMGVFSYLLKPIDYKAFKSVLLDAMESYNKRALELSLLSKNGYQQVTAPTDCGVEIKDYLQLHYTDDDITLGKMAQVLHISISTLARLIKQQTGITFTDYINQMRISTAKTLLEKQQMTVNEIAYAVGYSSQHYFSRIFKKYVGDSPGNYRRKCMRQNAPE